MEIDKRDPQMIDYYNSLSPNIKHQLSKLEGHISSVGELMLVAQSLNQQQKEPDNFE